MERGHPACRGCSEDPLTPESVEEEQELLHTLLRFMFKFSGRRKCQAIDTGGTRRRRHSSSSSSTPSPTTSPLPPSSPSLPSTPPLSTASRMTHRQKGDDQRLQSPSTCQNNELNSGVEHAEAVVVASPSTSSSFVVVARRRQDNHGCDSCSSSFRRRHHDRYQPKQQYPPYHHHPHRQPCCQQHQQTRTQPVPCNDVIFSGQYSGDAPSPLSHYLEATTKNSGGASSPQRKQRPAAPRLVSQQQMFLISLVLVAFLSLTDACSSRSTPKPRPPSPTLRPNITFQTYACPPAYAAWYCLNGATCFTVKIGISILYNCECADGFMGQRCEFKDLDGTYLPTRERLRQAAAQLSAGVGAAPLPLGLLLVIVLVALAALVYTKRRTRHKLERIQQDLLEHSEISEPTDLPSSPPTPRGGHHQVQNCWREMEASPTRSHKPEQRPHLPSEDDTYTVERSCWSLPILPLQGDPAARAYSNSAFSHATETAASIEPHAATVHAMHRSLEISTTPPSSRSAGGGGVGGPRRGYRSKSKSGTGRWRCRFFGGGDGDAESAVMRGSLSFQLDNHELASHQVETRL